MPVVAKAKKKSNQIAALKALEEHEAMIEERYYYALDVKNFQDEKTLAAINRMVVQMKKLAGEPRFYYKGASVPADAERLSSLQIKSLTWFAVRLFVACAEWDIKIENFKLPPGRCAKCRKKVK